MDYLKEIKEYIIKGLLTEQDFEKLNALNNQHVLRIIHQFVDLCNPDKLTVISDSEEDISYVRQKTIEKHEESKLNIDGHTVHYDGFITMSNHDQARDKGNTKILIPKGGYKPPALNTVDREDGLKEILKIMEDCMTNKKDDKSTWAIGGCIIIGIGVGFFFLQKSPLAFVGSILVGLGIGLVITAIISRKKE